jgi:hypothetical protein
MNWPATSPRRSVYVEVRKRMVSLFKAGPTTTPANFGERKLHECSDCPSEVVPQCIRSHTMIHVYGQKEAESGWY